MEWVFVFYHVIGYWKLSTFHWTIQKSESFVELENIFEIVKCVFAENEDNVGVEEKYSELRCLKYNFSFANLRILFIFPKYLVFIATYPHQQEFDVRAIL